MLVSLNTDIETLLLLGNNQRLLCATGTRRKRIHENIYHLYRIKHCTTAPIPPQCTDTRQDRDRGTSEDLLTTNIIIQGAGGVVGGSGGGAFQFISGSVLLQVSIKSNKTEPLIFTLPPSNQHHIGTDDSSI